MKTNSDKLSICVSVNCDDVEFYKFQYRGMDGWKADLDFNSYTRTFDDLNDAVAVFLALQAQGKDAYLEIESQQDVAICDRVPNVAEMVDAGARQTALKARQAEAHAEYVERELAVYKAFVASCGAGKQFDTWRQAHEFDVYEHEPEAV